MAIAVQVLEPRAAVAPRTIASNSAGTAGGDPADAVGADSSAWAITAGRAFDTAP